jgi:hypothetical protein
MHAGVLCEGLVTNHKHHAGIHSIRRARGSQPADAESAGRVRAGNTSMPRQGLH